jgi:hypothetical protein
MPRDLELPDLLHPELGSTFSAHEEHIELGHVFRLDRLLRPHPGDGPEDGRSNQEDGQTQKDGDEDPHDLSKARRSTDGGRLGVF